MNFLSFGNRKLPSSIAIFNFTSATDCPSAKKGFCNHPKECYAKTAERIYPGSLPYRRSQTKFWDLISGSQFAKMVMLSISRKKNKITKLRFSEAGDFRTQHDVNKFTISAEILSKHGLTVYGYVANPEFDYSELKKHTTINGQMFMVTNQIDVVSEFTRREGVIQCPADCNICDACATAEGKIIEIKKH